MVVWDVFAAAVAAALDDPAATATGGGSLPLPGARSGLGRAGAVRGLAWVLSGPAALAVALSSGQFVLWDPTSAAHRNDPCV